MFCYSTNNFKMARVFGGEDAFYVNCSNYVKGLQNDHRRRYKEKLSNGENNIQLPDPYALSSWENDPCKWPEVTFGDIYLYLIESPALFDKETMKAY